RLTPGLLQGDVSAAVMPVRVHAVHGRLSIYLDDDVVPLCEHLKLEPLVELDELIADDDAVRTLGPGVQAPRLVLGDFGLVTRKRLQVQYSIGQVEAEWRPEKDAAVAAFDARFHAQTEVLVVAALTEEVALHRSGADE